MNPLQSLFAIGAYRSQSHTPSPVTGRITSGLPVCTPGYKVPLFGFLFPSAALPLFLLPSSFFLLPSVLPRRSDMAPSPYTTTYVVLGKTYRYTHNYDYPTDTSTYYGGYNPFDQDTVRAVFSGYLIVLGEDPGQDSYSARLTFEFCLLTLTRRSCISGVIFGLQILGLIIVAIVYYKRQKRRKVSMWLPASFRADVEQ